MRLINAETRQLEEFFGYNIPKYAILSHRWSNDEVTFSEYGRSSVRGKTGFQKIENACIQAIKDSIQYVWIDTCCVDKSSSSELSEAINSMYEWYRESSICYVHLADVDRKSIRLEESDWFRRGWTLQELIAPRYLTFYDKVWIPLGDRKQNAHEIYNACGIPTDFWVLKKSISDFSVAQRMSWASKRKTTIIEDEAYCLLGIFGINMPLLYGEGGRSFQRLQQEIIKISSDESIFAWSFMPTSKEGVNDMPSNEELNTNIHESSTLDELSFYMHNLVTTLRDTQSHDYHEELALAHSPKDFGNCSEILSIPSSKTPYTMSNRGLEIELPIIEFSMSPNSSDQEVVLAWIGLLQCENQQTCELLGIVLSPSSGRYSSRRCSLGYQWFSTITIPSRFATQAETKKITLAVDHSAFPRAGLHRIQDDAEKRKVWFRPTSAVKQLGYSISGTVIALDLLHEGRWIPSTEWSSNSFSYCLDLWNDRDRTLTISRGETAAYDTAIPPKLFAIEFSSTSTEIVLEPFTIYVWRLWHDSAYHFPFSVKPGTRFEIEPPKNVPREKITDIIQQELEALDDQVIIDIVGEKHEMFITVNATDVLHHKIFTVTIDSSPFSG
jgi:hypothetical protein